MPANAAIPISMRVPPEAEADPAAMYQVLIFIREQMRALQEQNQELQHLVRRLVDKEAARAAPAKFRRGADGGVQNLGRRRHRLDLLRRHRRRIPAAPAQAVDVAPGPTAGTPALPSGRKATTGSRISVAASVSADVQDGKAEQDGLQGAEAIVDETGQAAAGAIGAARSRWRDEPGRSLEAWRPLVGARWTLVDTFERDGSRYIVARENEAGPPGLEVLTGRERQIVGLAALGRTNKEIAYALGLAHSTVRVLLLRASRKLGASSRADLLKHESLVADGAAAQAAGSGST